MYLQYSCYFEEQVVVTDYVIKPFNDLQTIKHVFKSYLHSQMVNLIV